MSGFRYADPFPRKARGAVAEPKVDYEALIAKAREEASVADCWLCRSYLNQLANALEAHREALKAIAREMATERSPLESCIRATAIAHELLLEPKP